MVLFSYTKIDNIWGCEGTVESHEDILWLDISMDVATGMDIL